MLSLTTHEGSPDPRESAYLAADRSRPSGNVPRPPTKAAADSDLGKGKPDEHATAVMHLLNQSPFFALSLFLFLLYLCFAAACLLIHSVYEEPVARGGRRRWRIAAMGFFSEPPRLPPGRGGGRQKKSSLHSHIPARLRRRRRQRECSKKKRNKDSERETAIQLFVQFRLLVVALGKYFFFQDWRRGGGDACCVYLPACLPILPTITSPSRGRRRV